MSKYLLLLLPLVLLILSCNTKSSDGEGVSNEVSVYKYSDSIVISNQFETNQPIQEGFEPGFVEQTTNKYGSNETQMLSQFKDFTNAMSNGDYDKCLEYINKDALKHIQKLAAAEGEHFELHEIAQMMSEEIKNIQEHFKQREVEISMVVPSLIRKIEDSDNIFIVFNNTTNLTGKNGKSFHISPIEKTLGISTDKGSNWSFITFDDEIPNMLSGVYNQEIINAIMDY